MNKKTTYLLEKKNCVCAWIQYDWTRSTGEAPTNLPHAAHFIIPVSKLTARGQPILTKAPSPLSDAWSDGLSYRPPAEPAAESHSEAAAHSAYRAFIVSRLQPT